MLSKIVFIEVSPAEREAARRDLIRALNGLPPRQNDSVVKEQATNNSLSQVSEVVTR